MIRDQSKYMINAIFVCALLGLAIGVAIGQWQLEQGWQQVLRDPNSFSGGPDSYRCAMGYTPLLVGVIGSMFGAFAGLIGSLGWLRFRKTPLTV